MMMMMNSTCVVECKLDLDPRKVDVRLPGKGNSKLPWREAGPPNHLDDKVDSDRLAPPASSTASSTWIRGGLVFKAHRWLYHSTLGSRVIKEQKKMSSTWICSGLLKSFR